MAKAVTINVAARRSSNIGDLLLDDTGGPRAVPSRTSPVVMNATGCEHGARPVEAAAPTEDVG
jgi:hypothetical protein